MLDFIQFFLLLLDLCMILFKGQKLLLFNLGFYYCLHFEVGNYQPFILEYLL